MLGLEALMSRAKEHEVLGLGEARMLSVPVGKIGPHSASRRSSLHGLHGSSPVSTDSPSRSVTSYANEHAVPGREGIGPRCVDAVPEREGIRPRCVDAVPGREGIGPRCTLAEMGRKPLTSRPTPI